jgi:hypothetical protein
MTAASYSTLLVPNIVEAILYGREPAEMTLAMLMRPFAVEWERQRQRQRADHPRFR